MVTWITAAASRVAGTRVSRRDHHTAATRELARSVMLDAADLQEEEAAWLNKEGTPSPPRLHTRVQPLYTVLDALDSMDYFWRVAYAKPIDVADGVRVTFLDAGVTSWLCQRAARTGREGRKRRVVFSR